MDQFCETLYNNGGYNIRVNKPLHKQIGTMFVSVFFFKDLVAVSRIRLVFSLVRYAIVFALSYTWNLQI